MKIKNYNIHISFLLAMTLLGNCFISLMFLSDKSPLFAFLLCAIATIGVSLVLLPVINRAFNKKGFLFYVLSAIVIALSLVGAVATLEDYIKFLDVFDSNKTSLVLLFVLVVLSLTFCSNCAFLKFGLLFGVITAFLILLLFIMSAGIYNTDNINIKSFAADLNLTATAFFKYFSVCVPTLCFAALSNHKANAKNTFFGVALGLVLAGVCLLQTALVLGTTAATQQLPYLTAVSAYSSGNLYIRQDGFVWFAFFSTATIKTALCLKAVWGIVKKIYKKCDNRS